jgi:hypothetical protein
MARTDESVAAKSRLPTKIFFNSLLFSVFQLCGQDEADQDSQAPAGLSKGNFKPTTDLEPEPGTV